jgi:enoyl-[acyl-carrier protein] reductase II
MDTLYSTRFDGLGCRVMKTDAAERAIRRGLDLPAAFFNSREIAAQLHIPFLKLFIGVLASGWKNARQLAYLANGFKAMRVATEEGDIERGVLPVGQATGLIRDEPTVAEVVARIVAEAEQVKDRLAGQFA